MYKVLLSYGGVQGSQGWNTKTRFLSQTSRCLQFNGGRNWSLIHLLFGTIYTLKTIKCAFFSSHMGRRRENGDLDKLKDLLAQYHQQQSQIWLNLWNMLGIRPSNPGALSLWILTTHREAPRSTDEETKAEGGCVIHPRSQSKEVWGRNSTALPEPP